MEEELTGLPAEPLEAEQDSARVPATITPQTDIIPLDEKGLPAPRTLEEMYRVARLFCQSQLVPKDYQASNDQPEKVATQKIMVATFMGKEIGLSMLAALRSIAVINGRPSVWGDAVPALAERTGIIESVKEYFKGSGDTLTAYCEVKRKDRKDPIIGQFSVEDAKVAGLWLRHRNNLSDKKKMSPWYRYPKRMLKMRAREAFRDAVPGALMGLPFAEVVRDIPPDADTQEAEIVKPSALADPPPIPAAETKTKGPAPAEPSPTSEDETPKVVKDKEGFPWVTAFANKVKVDQMAPKHSTVLKEFILATCQDFAVSPEEVQEEALKNFLPFWKQFNRALSSKMKDQDPDDQRRQAVNELKSKMQKPAADEDENFWTNPRRWKYLGGENFERAVKANMDDLRKMPAEFVDDIRDRWVNVIQMDLGPFPLDKEKADWSEGKTRKMESPPQDIPEKLDDIQERLLWFEENLADETLDAREVLNSHAEVQQMDYDSCRELLIQILMGSKQPDDQF